MSIQPLITFKAGQCELTRESDTNQKVKPVRTPGFVYLYQGEDEFVHFCWRPRDKPLDESELDLIMIPGDGSFLPYTGKESVEDSENVKSPTDGRIFVLKFNSSSQRYLFWLQSKSQHPRGDASWFSERDLKIGQIVDLLLNGEEIDVHAELSAVQNPTTGDEDETMEDVEGTDHSSSRNRHGSTGGAGADATGGDIREEGSESREGGADGGRAAAPATDVSAIVKGFVDSLKGGGLSGSSQPSSEPFTTLLDLLWPSHTIPTIEKASPELIDALCAQLPMTPFLLEAEVEDVEQIDPNSETARMAMQTLEKEEKIDVLKRILRAPQLRAALGSLTEALKTGALPTVAQGLKIDVEHGGFMRGGAMPLGGGEAVKAFLEGVKRTVEKDDDDDDDEDDDGMDTD
ncbi:proteasome complex subunit Rpn13 ubiquitin receptor-domain-containing protein [Paraphoma chrysanthemicola]|uniref:Proteasome complex subunit Rpn13 ubiquitin receptor-domain-containing protein n=1 Tax=Paraphoma chrysanthemicola TaxID=798071 RepID=A0A8K0RBC8_9PLEO|nr:proteasome complex subunit Rpn13 ubiquitin receptor-domain-containing protein [Paraphoma chrysanthemicola]